MSITFSATFLRVIAFTSVNFVPWVAFCSFDTSEVSATIAAISPPALVTHRVVRVVQPLSGSELIGPRCQNRIYPTRRPYP